MALPRKVLLSGAATGVNVVGGLARNKILAAFLTVGLFGIVSIGQQALSLAATLFAVGFPMGIVTCAAGLTTRSLDEQRREVSRIVWAVLALSLVLTLFTGAVLLGARRSVAVALTGEPGYADAVALILLAMPLLVAELCLYSIMEGLGRLRDIVVFKTVPVVAGLPVLYLLVRAYGLAGAAAGILIQEVLLVATALWTLRSLIRVDREATRAGSVVKPILRVAGLAFVAGASWLAADFLVKRGILLLLGQEANGFVQGVTKVTDIYPSLALAWLTVHLFPSLAAAGEDRARAAAVVQRTLFIAVSLIVPVILVLFAGSELILRAIYRAEFAAAGPLFRAMLATGILKVLAWTLTWSLLALGLRREWFVSSMIAVLLYGLGMLAGLSFHKSVFLLPLVQGIVFAVQGIYCVAALGRRGYRLGGGFPMQAGFMAGATALLAASLSRPFLLVPLAALYAWFTVRFHLWEDLRGAWRRFRADRGA